MGPTLVLPLGVLLLSLCAAVSMTLAVEMDPLVADAWNDDDGEEESSFAQFLHCIFPSFRARKCSTTTSMCTRA